MDYKKGKSKKYSGVVKKVFDIGTSPIEQKKTSSKIKIQYNKTIYFKKSNENGQIKDESIKSPTKDQDTSDSMHTKKKNLINEEILKSDFKPENNKEKDECEKDGSPEFDGRLNDKYFNTFHVRKPESKLFHRCITQRDYQSNNRYRPNKLLVDHDSILFINCMNCGNSIQYENIEDHSSKCTRVTEEVMINENKNYELKEINYKINKLREHLSNIINENVSIPQQFEGEMKYISTILSQYINESLKIEEVSMQNIKECKKILKNIKTFSLTNKSSLSSQILLDRSKVLITEKIKRYREMLRSQGILKNSKITPTQSFDDQDYMQHRQKNYLTFSTFSELKKKNSLPNSLISSTDSLSNTRNKKSYYNIVDTIVSDIDRNSLPLSVNSSRSNGSDAFQEDASSKENSKIIFDVGTIFSDKMKEKRDFYKEIFKIKFEKLHSSHRGQHIPHNQLWNEYTRLKIQSNNRNMFILSELNNPMKYSKLNKKINGRKLEFNLDTSMEIIDEEKI